LCRQTQCRYRYRSNDYLTSFFLIQFIKIKFLKYVKPFSIKPAQLINHSTTTTATTTQETNFFLSTPRSWISIFGIPEKEQNKTKIETISDQIGSEQDERERQCGHVVTTYIVPSIMHFAAFIIGFIYFRINENEQLYSLMEKVFLAVSNTMKTVSQDKVIKRLKYEKLERR